MTFYSLGLACFSALAFQKYGPLKPMEKLDSIGRSYVQLCNISFGFYIGLKVAEIALNVFRNINFVNPMSLTGQVFYALATFGLLCLVPKIEEIMEHHFPQI